MLRMIWNVVRTILTLTGVYCWILYIKQELIGDKTE